MSLLILLNGAPGSGKSTLARLLVDERPFALLLDIDTLRAQLGRWSDDPQGSGIAARRLALAMIRIHLQSGFDVVVPQFLFRSPFVHELEQAATETASRFVEIVLVSSPEEAAARFAARSSSTDPIHQDAVRLQKAPGAPPIEELCAAMLEMTRGRQRSRYVESLRGDIAGTLAAIRTAIELDLAEIEQGS